MPTEVHTALEMRLALIPICVLVIFLVPRSTTDCVMFGLCNQKQYCLVSHPPVSVPGNALKELCDVDSPVQCCDQDQLKGLENNFVMLGFLLRAADDLTCYNGMRDIFCDIACSSRQSELVKVTGHNATDGAVTSIDFRLSRNKAQVIYDACNAIDDLFLGNPVEMICGREDCNTTDLFRSIGKSESSGDNLTTEDTANGRVSAVTEELQETLEDLPLPQRLFKRPLWLAMLLTFLGLTLLFLLGLAFHWCINRQSEDSTAAGSYSPPIGCYSKVGATIQFGSTWLFARQGALVARFPRMTLLLTVTLLAVACCGFLRFRVTTDPVELWSDPNSRARLEKAYFDEHFGPFYRTEQIIIRPVNATPYVRNNHTFGTVFDKDFLKSVLDLQTQVTRVRAFSEVLGREVALEDICYKPLEPASHECGVFSPLEYFQSNATLLDTVVEEMDYLDHLKFCTKVMAADKGPLSGCRGRAGAPMFGNVVFGGIEGEGEGRSY
ncbi:NPC intracellular cholesterol transporter 1 [Taenia solium]|eukprot:TsM_001088500 transcript=TsM_001088500 gene=TsM_001088500